MKQQLTINGNTGLLNNINVSLSPNCDDRPRDTVIDLLVIHNISLPPGQFGGDYIRQFFCNQLDYQEHKFFETIKNLQVSSHLLINRAGEITQFVPFHKRAWHAGKSNFQGREGVNDFSIGIELEGCDELPYTQDQYVSLCQVTESLFTKYRAMCKEKIVGHSDIAPGRKTDPGTAFDWQYYLNNIME